jgi:3-carboxy-cis,cis-muconate cycloisomerase
MSTIFDSFLSTPEAIDAFEGKSFVDAMLRFEAALASAQAMLGIIPQEAAKSIIGTCKVELFDVARIVRDSSRAGSVAIPLVRALKETVGLFNPEAVQWVHYGSTSQDVIDTAMVLATRDVLQLIVREVDKAMEALLALGERHADTPMLARTLMQPACLTSFGFKCIGWAAPLARSRERLKLVGERAFKLQLGGTAGTLGKMQGREVELVQRVAEELGLGVPSAAWHAQRDEWVALGCELGLLCGSLGKIGKDLSLMSQFEVAELAEPHEPGRGSPAAMPHKHNPVASMVALAAAQRAPQRVAALLAAMAHEHERALGGWQAELAEWPQLVMSTHGSARALAGALPGLQVDANRMRVNVEAVRASLPKATAQEWFNAAMVDQAARLTHAQLVSLRQHTTASDRAATV